MASFEIRHSFDLSEEDFWKHTFLDPEFNEKLYKERLRFHQYERLEDREQSDGTHSYKVRVEPNMEMPSAVQKLVGSSFTYTEQGTYDPKSHRYRFSIEPSKLADKIDVKGEMYTESKGDNKCERVVRVELDVRIFGVGKVVQNFVEKGIRDSYEEAARFTNEWAKQKGLL